MFQFVRLRFEAKVIDEGTLPRFFGPALRGALGLTFRKMVCVTHLDDCYSCLLKFQCPFTRFFEPFAPPDHPVLQLLPLQPHHGNFLNEGSQKLLTEDLFHPLSVNIPPYSLDQNHLPSPTFDLKSLNRILLPFHPTLQPHLKPFLSFDEGFKHLLDSPVNLNPIP